ncbi:MAG: PBP1A family penicillin-binding protein [Micropepsaceae bacterium]
MGKPGKGKGRTKPQKKAAKTRLAAPLSPPPAPRFWWKVGYALLVCGIWTIIGLAGVLAYFSKDLPSTDGLWRQERTQAVTLLDVNGRVIARRGISGGELVTFRDLPDHVAKAVIASEDRRFYSHIGIDPWGLGRAMWVNLQSGRVVQGGSTITQQLAKNLFLKPERTFGRKVQEALLAIYLEMSFSKEDILSLYLNKVYFGAGAYGIDAASRRYFNKSATRLSLVEAAILAGLLKAPTRYSPINGTDLAWERAGVVLQSMVETGAITKEDREDAIHTRPKFASGTSSQGNQYFTDWIMEQLPELVGRSESDLVVETTFDLDMQRSAEEAVFESLSQEKRGDLQGALIALTADGSVRAMVGGRSYGQSMFNRATLARRQPGSAFKPFVYLTALEGGLTPVSTVVDQPVTYRGWTPANFKAGYAGEMPLSEALAKSINSVSVQLCLQFSPESVVETARRLGITSDLSPVPSLALGTSEVTLSELVTAYAPFANGGYGAIAHGVKRVTSIKGDVLYSRSGSGLGRLVALKNVGQMNLMLTEAVATGTGKLAALSARPSAGKTGTTQDFKDAWFVGYTRQLVAGVWLGTDEGTPMGKTVTGGTLPAVIWKRFMERATAGQPVAGLPGIEQAQTPDASSNDFDDVLARVLKDQQQTSSQN